MQADHSSSDSHPKQRATPSGLRRLPGKSHTLDAPTKSTIPANGPLRPERSKTVGSHHLHSREEFSATPLPKHSFSQPTSSPLSIHSFTDLDTFAPAVTGAAFSTRLPSSKRALLSAGAVTTLPVRTPGSHKSSGASADRDVGPTLDMKRLLSKPAKHTLASSSTVSLPSDSEISASSRSRAHVSRPITGFHERPTTSPGPASMLAQREGSRDTSSSSRSLAKVDDPKPRNVLRRRSSRPSTQPSAGVSEEPARHRSLSSAKRRMRSMETLHITPPKPAAGTVPLSTATPRPIPAGITPAGQVALAYKQQELRREEIAELSGWNDNVRDLSRGVTTISSGNRHSTEGLLTAAARNNVQDDEEEQASGPYYTVFGSSSGHVVPFGSSKDYSPQLDQRFTFNDVPRKHHRSLSRKVSGRLKKVADIVKGDRDFSPSPAHRLDHDDWRPYDGYPLAPKSPRSPIRMSVDDQFDTSMGSISSRHSTPTGKRGSHGKGRSMGGGSVEERRGLYPVKSAKDKDQEDGEEEHASGKFWKLVKRISTGGLRDKYRHQRTSTPPPVPPLPVDLQKLTETRTTVDIRQSPVRDHTPDETSQTLSSRASYARVRPSTGLSLKTSMRHTIASRPSTGGKASSLPSVPHLSTTTRSSSPVSSDLASSGFSPRPQSPRSSSSSYPEESPSGHKPSTPKSKLGQYVIPEHMLSRLQSAGSKENERRKRRPSRSHSEPDHRRFPSTPDEEVPSLPLPSRHRGAGSQDVEMPERSPSPQMPSFSTHDPVNNFISTPLAASGSGPPPLPRRNPRRKPASIELTISDKVANVSPNPPLTPRTPRAHTQIFVDAEPLSRTSTSTARNASPTTQTSLSPSSTSLSPSTASSHNQSPLTFREIESPRHVWTEQEKADKWEDLLQRSERAGGTLHIGESHLLSDKMRLSQCSDV
ncbi:uncharacterized protein LAESUDRAFT_713601 [Laetiporus sulphureus 93-53]|uniref:Uncharacterized protein n=1 Tax=Laetiporus sulphureus 93-53 TaxID=1314785 RepID=A0A165EPS0_9APHY|nr:uncharacterized protein LAESUDRAFT_713601 [Laetiporus sulphureus 93-53]KZT07508.1 hypothetical protein LAESUDRAFT_713601 [Laetiporus sulphureus 93-53]